MKIQVPLKNLLVCLIFVFAAQASFAKSVECASPSGEILSFQASPLEVSLNYSSSRGPEYAPIEDGPVREVSIAYYKMAFGDLKEILSGFSSKWKAEACTINVLWWLSSCSSGASLNTAQPEVSPVQVKGMFLSKLSESGASGEQNLYRFRISFEKDGNTHFVPLVFPQEFCKISGF